MVEESVASPLEESLRAELHELCQPLTTLRFRLELALMDVAPGHADEVTELREAIEGALGDVQRIFAHIDQLRSRVLGDPVQERPDA